MPERPSGGIWGGVERGSGRCRGGCGSSLGALHPALSTPPTSLHCTPLSTPRTTARQSRTHSSHSRPRPRPLSRIPPVSHALSHAVCDPASAAHQPHSPPRALHPSPWHEAAHAALTLSPPLNTAPHSLRGLCSSPTAIAPSPCTRAAHFWPSWATGSHSFWSGSASTSGRKSWK